MKKEIIREKTVPFSVKKVQFFFQIVKYKGYTRKTLVEEKTSSYFKENTYVQVLKVEINIPRNHREIRIGHLEVPPVSPPHLEGCSIIDIEYFFVVSIKYRA